MELAHLLTSHSVLIAAIQETKFCSSSNPHSFPGYTLIRRDRPTSTRAGGGGLAFLIHHTVSFTHQQSDQLFPNDSTIEHQAINVTITGTPYLIFNIYIPPATSCPPAYSPNLSPLLEQQDHNVVILGDFNAHNAAWYSATNDDRAAARGVAIVNALDPSPMVLLNGDHPTRVPTDGPPSSPDLTFVSAHVALGSSWTPLTRLNSDHLPIAISLNSINPPAPTPRRTFTNYHKADWEAYEAQTEEAFRTAPPPTCCATGERFLREVIRDATRHNIPRGCRKDFIPNLPTTAIPLIQERDRLRETDPQHPNLPDLNHRITTAIATHFRQTWIEKVQDCNFRQDPSKHWSLLKSLSGKPSLPPNQPITFGNRTLTSNKLIAQAFCKQFTLVKNFQRDRTTRQLRRHIIKQHPLSDSPPSFTPDQVRKAIDNSGNSIATGPDNLNILHLRHLGPHGISFLTSLYNISIRSAEIPAIWKAANIITIPKPGKPLSDSSSYRPISLLSPAVKVLERLLLPALTAVIPLADTQHGFRPLHSTTTALLPIAQTIASGFNKECPPRRTTIMAIDFSKAFDSVPHPQLIKQIADLPLHPNIVRWLSCYLNGRTAKCTYNNTHCSFRPVHSGVPQGSVISPALFNLYVSDYPNTAPIISSYADDFTAAASAVEIPDSSATLSAHATDVSTWARQKGLTVSIPKSHSTLFTSHTHQSRTDPHITWEGSDLTLCRTPKILGVTLDTHFTFTPHTQSVCERIRPRLNILKSLASTTWGQSKEVLIITYKALIKSVMTYAAPIWFPNSSPSAIAKLQVIQNAALRIATGSHKMAAVAHLHSETEMLPVANSLSLLCSQYLASSLRPHHPSFPVVNQTSGRRNKKHTLQSRFLPSVLGLLAADGSLPPNSYSHALKSLHTSAVSQYIASAPHNRVLAASPPAISPTETTLSRATRCTLSQLRSGFCRSLNSYQQRIGAAADSSCPECHTNDHSVPHLFDCPSHPTTLTTVDLWERPTEVAGFLETLPSFDHLRPLPRPPPEPPPPQP